MSICLITTTINVPEVLRLYRAMDGRVKFIIAGDQKTNHEAVIDLCSELGDVVYLSPDDQEKLGYASSRAIGWNCIMRRSIALLLAIRMGNEIIITIDDDNIPADPTWFYHPFKMRLTKPYYGPMARGHNGWFNIGDLFDPPVAHRGFPSFDVPHGFEMAFTVKADVGVVAGLWYGDPDINAAERIVKRPLVTRIADVLQRGLVVEAGTFAPFNSQNTAYTRELAPLMPVWPHVGRYDDIWSSFVAQRVMWETGDHLFYGPPFTWQERNPQSALRNLKDEMYGMSMTVQFCEDLRKLELGDGSPVEKLVRAYGALQEFPYLPDALKAFLRAWVADLEEVL